MTPSKPGPLFPLTKASGLADDVVKIVAVIRVARTMPLSKGAWRLPSCLPSEGFERWRTRVPTRSWLEVPVVLRQRSISTKETNVFTFFFEGLTTEGTEAEKLNKLENVPGNWRSKTCIVNPFETA